MGRPQILQHLEIISLVSCLKRMEHACNSATFDPSSPCMRGLMSAA